MKCPKCNTLLQVTTEELEKETLYVSIKFEGSGVKAKAIGKVISNMADLLSEVDKSIGDGRQSVNVMFGGIEMKDKEIVIKFLVLPRT